MDCKLCFKRFSNGKALGAHMRSHYAILPLPRKSPPLLPDPAPRLKRPRGINLDHEEEVTEEAAAAAELEMEEGDVALCLIMLSRDVWRSSSPDDSSKSKIHRCEKCDKVFKSSQGLGSHKASHSKRIKDSFQERGSESAGDQVHECEFCPRIFKSAQALGGHKRSHFPAPKFGRNLADLNLNLPPPSSAASAVAAVAVNGEILA